MRITIATGPMLPVPALRGGAIPRMWHGLAREFAQRGHETCIFARSFPGQAGSETVDGIHFLRAGGYDQGTNVTVDLLKDFGYAAAALARLPAADVLVTNDFWLPALASRLRRRAGRVVVNANRYPKGQYFLYGTADRIAAASCAVRDAIALQAPALGPRIRVFPNPVDTGVMHPRDGSRPAGPSVLLYAGRLHPEKGVHLLASAFARIAARCPGWRLRIVGPWRIVEGGAGWDYVEALHATLKDLPAQIAEPVFSPAELAAEYQAASLFCYPSLADRGESFGLAALESMACGAPPVVSALECFRDFVSDGETGWVFDHRSAEPEARLAELLERLMNDPAQLARVGRRASESARAFGYAPLAERYLADFGELVGAAGA